MKAIFICGQGYAVGEKNYKYGDIVEDKILAKQYVRMFPYLFAPLEEHEKYTEDDLWKMTVKDLQNLAKVFNITIKTSWLKADLVNHLHKKINE